MGQISNMKEPKYKVGVDAVYERPTAFWYYLKRHKSHGNATIKALTPKAREEMEVWIRANKKRINQMCEELDIDMPEEIVFE